MIYLRISIKSLIDINHKKTMPLTEKQSGVLKSMIVGLSATLGIVGFASYMNPFGYSESFDSVNRLNVAISCCLIPAFFLTVSIGRLAKHRFLTPEDIDGGGLSDGTPQAKILQSLIQNTIEQSLLASFVYCAWSVVMPAQWLSTVPSAALAFGLGRILFFTGYNKGAQARALGFTLSFYPSLVMLFAIIATLLWRQVT